MTREANETMRPCVFCSDSDEPVSQWTMEVNSYWAGNPLFAAVFDSSYLLLTLLLVICAYDYPQFVPWAAALAATVFGVSEYLPLSTLPLATDNATNAEGQVALMMLVTRMVIVVIAVVSLAELARPTSPETFTTRVISSGLVAVPAVALPFALVSTSGIGRKKVRPVNFGPRY